MSATGAFERDLIEQLPLILTGLEQTLKLAVSASIGGFVLGIIIFYFSTSKQPIVRAITKGYISFFVGMPLIVLLFLMYYGLPQWGIKYSPFTIALIGFTMNVAAYNAAYLNTAFNGLDQNELEAAKAQGFSTIEVFQLITLPQVLRQSIPALTNQCIGNTLSFLHGCKNWLQQIFNFSKRTCLLPLSI